MRYSLYLLCFLAIIMVTSCKKTPSSKTTSCTSVLYGYIGPDFQSMPCSFGIINPSTGTISGLFTSTVWSTSIQAAFNTSDSSYYVFLDYSKQYPYYDTLLKMTSSGTVSLLTRSVSDTAIYQDVIYNRANNKLYCIKDGGLAELTVTGSTYSSSATLVESVGEWTVDNATGDMYGTGLSSSFATIFIKYQPGTSTISVVAVDSIFPVKEILGLQFNKNDNMLYAVRFKLEPCDFIRIDPAAGSITSLASVSFNVNADFYSAVIDPCSNRYIFSSFGFISQLSMTGTLVHQSSTGATDQLFQGLAIGN